MGLDGLRRTTAHPPVRLYVRLLEDRSLPSATFTDAPVVPVIDATMQAHLRAVFQLGQQLGNRADVFTKIGDSISYSPDYLAPLGRAGYSPVENGVPPGLLGTLAYFSVPASSDGGNSFTHTSAAAYPGWISAQALPNVPGELAADRPSVALIMLGTNDNSWGIPLATFQANLTLIVNECLGRGVIPVLSTIPHNFFVSGADVRVPAYNQAIADVAAAANVPLWNFWKGLEGLPNEGLGDNLHPSTSPQGAGYLGPGGLLYGYNVRNLTALEVLDTLRNTVMNDGPAAPDPAPPTTAWSPITPGEHVIAVGGDAGSAPTVSVYDAGSGALKSTFLAYAASFTGGVRVAVGDVNGDGVPDIVTVPGSGGGPVVQVFDGATGQLVRTTMALDPSFRGGLYVATGDVDGDGTADVIVGAGEGGGPWVRVFSGADGSVLREFLAYDVNFTGGVRVAAGDVNGDGHADLIAGAGPGGGPEVRVFDGATGAATLSWFAYAPSVTAGVFVAAGDVDGDGRAEVITGAGMGGPHVQVFDGSSGAALASYFANDPTLTGGVRVGTVPGANGLADILAGSGPSEPVFVRRLNALNGADLEDLSGFDGLAPTGVFVGGS